MPGFIFYPVTIDWGDDGPPTTFSFGASDLVSIEPNDIVALTSYDPTLLQHTYPTAGTYVVHLTITTESGEGGGGGPDDPANWFIDQSWTVVVGGDYTLSMIARESGATYSLD